MDGRTLIREAAMISDLRMMVARRANMILEARATLTALEAKATDAFIAEKGGEKAVGSNEAARSRAILLALGQDPTCKALTQSLLDLEAQQRIDEAKLLGALDSQRARFYAARYDLVAAGETIDWALGEQAHG
jgi:hypothetical protein